MSPRVQLLPDHVANLIAAGEVVERPASVVKELVENALDAGAGRIEVTLRNGGKTEIRVVDDGCGMERADAVLALDRHATSKIREAEDLAVVGSLGFRGEALPSIAAVSRFELITAQEGEDATRVRVRSGRIQGVEAAARRRGTTVTVHSLFQEQPARAKFLRSAAAETRAASDVLVGLALSHPEVEFRLESNGRELLYLARAPRIRDRVAAIWGVERAQALIEIAHQADAVRVEGLIQRPDTVRLSARRRYLFVNGRPFIDRGLLRVADEAYRTTLPARVRPSLFLYLTVEPSGVDVNVHPAKQEVRFRDRSAVEEAIHAAIRTGLSDLSSAAPLDSAAAEWPGSQSEPPGALRGGVSVERPRHPLQGVPGADPASQLAFFVRGAPLHSIEEESGEAEGPAAPEVKLSADLLSAAPPMLWQLHRTYILSSTRDGLLIIDQHSAHERILYEEIMRRFTEGGGEAQHLLFPLTLRLSPAEHSAAQELTGLLRRIGFQIEPFGDRTLLVRAAPHPHSRFDPERCLRDMIRELTDGSPLVDSARNQHERIAKSMACKGAIKAGEALSHDEMTELLDRLFATELPGHDVHGRPTVVRLTLRELARRFGRS
ncbi:MAG: DNA mismatch repair endonuclease MutL [Gemmatimonadota bacterium]